MNLTLFETDFIWLETVYFSFSLPHFDRHFLDKSKCGEYSEVNNYSNMKSKIDLFHFFCGIQVLSKICINSIIRPSPVNENPPDKGVARSRKLFFYKFYEENKKSIRTSSTLGKRQGGPSLKQCFFFKVEFFNLRVYLRRVFA